MMATPREVIGVIITRRTTMSRGGERSMRALLRGAPSSVSVVEHLSVSSNAPPPGTLASKAFANWLRRRTPDLREWLRENRVDRLHANDVAGYWLARAAIPRGHISLHVRDVPEGGPAMRLALATAHVVVCVSDDVRDVVRTLVPARRRARVVSLPNPVDPDWPRASRWPERRLLVVGAIEPRKNQGALLSALNRRPPKFAEEWHLEFVGEVVDTAYYKSLRWNTGTPRLRATAAGWVPDVPARMASSRALVSVSRREGLPRAVLEAATIGVPVVCLDVPGARQVLGPSLSRHSIVSTVAEVVERMERLSHGLPPDWRHAIEERSSTLRREWAPRRLFPEFLKLLGGNEQ